VARAVQPASRTSTSNAAFAEQLRGGECHAPSSGESSFHRGVVHAVILVRAGWQKVVVRER